MGRLIPINMANALFLCIGISSHPELISLILAHLLLDKAKFYAHHVRISTQYTFKKGYCDIYFKCQLSTL